MDTKPNYKIMQSECLEYQGRCMNRLPNTETIQGPATP